MDSAFQWDTAMKAMYDYIDIIKQLHKDSINLDNVQYVGANRNGACYEIPGCRSMKLVYNPENKLAKIQGSIPYWINGQNFDCTMYEYSKGINLMEQQLKIKLSDAVVNKLEFGAILKAPMSANKIIAAHSAPAGMQSAIWDNGRYFSNSDLNLKLYNAKTRVFQNLSKATQHELEAVGFDRKAEYVKVEAHYKRPHMTLNRGAGIIVSDIFTPGFIDKAEKDLLYQYNRLMKIKTVEIPNDKRHLKTDHILLLTLAGVAENMGRDAKALLYSFLNQIPDATLSKNDKKARQAQIRKLLKQVTVEAQSKYDLSDLLQESLSHGKSA